MPAIARMARSYNERSTALVGADLIRDPADRPA